MLLPLLLAWLHAALGVPADGGSASSAAAVSPSGGFRKWWIACSSVSTLLLLCTNTMYTKLGWRTGALLDSLWLALRAGAVVPESPSADPAMEPGR